MTLRRSSPFLLAMFWCACTCNDKTTPTDGMKPPADATTRKLNALPDVPKLDIAAESLPGADGALAIVAARPKGEFQGEVRPTVTFSKPVKSLEMVETQRAGDAEKPFATITPAIAGEWRWLGSASAEFVPKGLVPMSTEFTVTVLAGLKALDGASLAADYSFSFTTPALELQDVSPPRGYAWVKPDDTVSLLFNQPVKDADLAAALSFSVEGDPTTYKAVVKSRVSIEEERRKAADAARANGRGYQPMSDEDRGFRNHQTRYVVAAEKPLPLDKVFTLNLDPALKAEEGPRPMVVPEALTFRTYGPLKLSSASFCRGEPRCSRGPLYIFTTNEVDLSTVKDRLKISPAVEINWDESSAYAPHSSWEIGRDSPYARLSGNWKPGTQYKIDIAPGVGDVFKQADGEGLHTTLRTADLSPSLIFGGGLSLVEATKESPVVPVEVANLNTLTVELWKLTVPELVQRLAPERANNQAFRAPDFRESEKLKYQRNAARVHPIQLKKIFGEAKGGFAMVHVTSPDLEYQNQERQLVQVTDLAAHLKVGPKSSLVWVTSLSTGAPVADADITIYDQNASSLWTGKTNADGFADVPGTVALKVKNPEYAWQYPFLVAVAQKDSDVSATADTWADGVEPYEFGLTQGWEGEQPTTTSLIFTDRGIYRPGDTVYAKGIIRYRTVGELRAPTEGSQLKVRVTDSKSEKVTEQTLKLTKYGTFTLTAKIPPEAPTGYFTITAEGTVPSGNVEVNASFRVEEYRAPQFRVDVETKSKSLIAGEQLQANVFARYLFGGAMSNSAAKWSVQRSSTTFTSELATDFTFDQETWWWDDGAPQPSNGFFASGNGVVDAKGALEVKAGAVEAPAGKPYTYTIEGEVTDVNRQAVAGRAEVMVHPAAFYAGLKANTSFMQVGTEYPIDVLAVNTEGKRVAGRTLEVTITNRGWKSVRKKDASGGFSTISEPFETEVSKCDLVSTDTSVQCKFKPASAGFFIVRAKVKDDQNREHSATMGLYATGSDWVAWQRADNDRVELILDKAKYDVGDVAKVLIKSPYPEAKAMVTVEREGIIERRLVNLKGSVVTIDVPITEEMVPTMYVGVMIMRARVAEGGVETGDDPGRPNARVGLVKLSVEKKAKRLTVDLKTDRKEYQPRDTVNVDVAVKDSAGKGVNGEATLYVVDEAVLRLTAYTTPDPIDSIFPERPLSMRIGEPLLHLVRKRSYGEKGEASGGGGGNGEGAGFRSNFKTTVLFSPTVEVKDGVAKATFTLPDNLTTFRVMAVVVTQADRFGSGETSLQVNKPVMALPAMPRFARVGDAFEAGVVVHSHGAGAGEVTVTATVEGGAQLTGPAEQKVQIAEGAPKEVRFAFKAVKPGLTKFRFKASNGTNTDGVEEKIPLELPIELDAVATYGDTTDQRVEGITPPKGVYEDQGGLTVSMSSTALGGFSEGFQQLIEYPYGCLEQQSSRLVPFIALREVAGQFGVPWPERNKKKAAADDEFNALLNTYLFRTLDVSKERDPDAVITSTVKSILSLQESDGAFKYWSDSWCSSSWSSAYATLALGRAKEVGFDVSTERLNRAEAFLTKVVGGTCHPCELSCPDETRVFAAYVLARLKKPVASSYGEFYTRRNSLPLFSRALLANAMYVGGGDRKQANTLMQELLNFAKESPKGIHFEEVHGGSYATYFHSDTRTTGVMLQALTDIQPNHPYVGKMAKYLTSVRQGNGEWRSTQEAAFSLMGLTEVLRTKERDTPDFNAKVAFGASTLVEQPFKGRSMATQVKHVPMSELLSKAQGAEQKLTFSKGGTGVLYYTALLRYAPSEMPTKALDNGLFVQRWFEPYLGGGQTTKFVAGDLVRIRVRVASNQERHWVAFEVPLPAGLEPVDTTLATSAKLPGSPSEEGRGTSGEGEGEGEYEDGSAEGDGEGFSPWAYGFWSPFTHTEMRDSRVIVFADHLPPGVHVTSFVARATTPGTFVLKPAKGTLMYEPEVWGRSEGGTFEIELPTTLSQK